MFRVPYYVNRNFARCFSTNGGGIRGNSSGFESSVFIAPHPQKHVSPFEDTNLNPLIIKDGTKVPRYREMDGTNLIECVRFRTLIGYLDDEWQPIVTGEPSEEISKTFVGGEDAYAVLRGGGRDMICQSDGVSSWRATGVDSGCFARKQVSVARDAAAQQPVVDSSQVFWNAVQGVMKSGIPGSATLSVCMLDYQVSQKVLDITQLGDCSVMVLRPLRNSGKFSMLYKSTPQVQAMDTPVQISSLHAQQPEREVSGSMEDQTASDNMFQYNMQDEILKYYPTYKRTGTLVNVAVEEESIITSRKRGPVYCTHNALVVTDESFVATTDIAPISLEYYAIKPTRSRICVSSDDIVLLGSDGVFDNLFDHEIISICDSVLAKHSYHDANYLDCLALAVGEACVEACVNKKKDTPYANAARNDFILWNGGRIDDICLIASRVV